MPILIKSKTGIANSDRASVRWPDARLNSICEVRLAYPPLRDTQLILNVERRDALMQCNDLFSVSNVPDCFVREIDNLYHFLRKRHQQHNRCESMGQRILFMIDYVNRAVIEVKAGPMLGNASVR
jgi:hypothetical protein